MNINLKNLLLGSAAVGVATLGTASGLQFAYKKFDFYPPKPVFYFFTGALAFAALDLFGAHEKLKELAS